MPDAYRIHNQQATYFLTLTIVGWADALLRIEHKTLICESLNYCVENKGLEIFSYVIMSSHIHLLARAEYVNLSDIIRDFKKFTSTQLIKSMKQGNESRKEWLVELFKNQNGKQTKKSINQVWQYNRLRRRNEPRTYPSHNIPPSMRSLSPKLKLSFTLILFCLSIYLRCANNYFFFNTSFTKSAASFN